MSGLSGTVPRPLVAAQPPQPVSSIAMRLATPQLQVGPQVGGNRGHNGPWALPGHQGRKQPGDPRPGGGGVSDPEKPGTWQGAGCLMAACPAGAACGPGAEREGGRLRGGPGGRGLLRTAGVWRRPRGWDTQLTAASLPWRRERDRQRQRQGEAQRQRERQRVRTAVAPEHP